MRIDNLADTTLRQHTSAVRALEAATPVQAEMYRKLLVEHETLLNCVKLAGLADASALEAQYSRSHLRMLLQKHFPDTKIG